MILFFRNRTAKPTFSKGELSLILGLYSDRVKKGEWRDYAIDSLPGMAVFSVFRATREQAAYVIAKIPGRSFLKPPQYTVYAGTQPLKEGPSLRDVLSIFDDQTA